MFGAIFGHWVFLFGASELWKGTGHLDVRVSLRDGGTFQALNTAMTRTLVVPTPISVGLTAADRAFPTKTCEMVTCSHFIDVK